MAVVVVIIYILLLLLIRRCHLDLLSKRFIVMIVSFWMLCLFVSTFNPYDLFPVSGSTYFWLIVNVASLCLGFLIAGNKNKGQINKKNDYYYLGFDKLLGSKVYFLFLFLAIGLTWYITFQQRSVVLMYNLGYLRENFYEAMFAGKSWLAFLYVNFLQPAYEFALFLVCFLILYKRKWAHIILLIAFIAPFIFLSGGRTRAMMIVFYFVFAFIANTVFNKSVDVKARLSLNVKHVFGISVALIALFLLFSYTSVLRLGSEELNKESMSAGIDKSLTQICTYSTGSFRALDYATSHDYIDKVGGYKYGRATIGGLESFMERIVRHLVGIQLPNVNEETMMYLQETEISVGKGAEEKFNYAYTNAIYHYFDFGYLGIILWPFILGVCFRRSIGLVNKKPSIASLALVAYCFEIGIYSVFSLLIATDPFAIPYIVLLVFLAKRRTVCRIVS